MFSYWGVKPITFRLSTYTPHKVEALSETIGLLELAVSLFQTGGRSSVGNDAGAHSRRGFGALRAAPPPGRIKKINPPNGRRI
jgi:hypothetical protein